MARRLTSFSGASAVVAAVALAAGLSSCATSNGRALAQKACHHVALSLASYRRAQASPGSADAARERANAQTQLRAALPIAATAAGDSSQWQALMATLSNSTRVPESVLVHALEAQCALASSPNAQPPPYPAS